MVSEPDVCLACSAKIGDQKSKTSRLQAAHHVVPGCRRVWKSMKKEDRGAIRRPKLQILDLYLRSDQRSARCSGHGALDAIAAPRDTRSAGSAPVSDHPNESECSVQTEEQQQRSQAPAHGPDPVAADKLPGECRIARTPETLVQRHLKQRGRRPDYGEKRDRAD